MSESSAPAHARMHALDGLRATMMLLGIVLHTAASYTVIDLGAAWPYKDVANTVVADLVVLFVHLFRMPIFFALAGFFAALLYSRRGAGGLVFNRLQRIALPLGVALFVLYPLVSGGFAFTSVAKTGSLGEAWAAFVAMAGTSELYLPNGTMHLWFIYDLLFFYAGALLIALACAVLPAAWRARFTAAMRALVARPVLRVLVPSALTCLTLLPMRGVLRTSTGFAPDFEVLMAYGVFFGFGWLLYAAHESLSGFVRFAWTQTFVATALYFVFELFVVPVLSASFTAGVVSIAQSVVAALAVWMLFFGVTGLFLRYFDEPSARVRYVVGASYWVYLVHLPLTIWLPGLLVHSGLSVWSRMLTVVSLTTVVAFLTYDWFVRSSPIGAVLNGTRYARRLGPRTGTAPA